MIIGLVAIIVAVAVLCEVPARVLLAVQSGLYGNVPTLHGCADLPPKSIVEAELAKENPFLIRADVYDAGAWSSDDCPDKAHIRIDFAGTDARRELEAYLARAGAWDPTAGWTWRDIPVSLINV